MSGEAATDLPKVVPPQSVVTVLSWQAMDSRSRAEQQELGEKDVVGVFTCKIEAYWESI